MKKYWLVLFPDTFLWIKENKGIIYNSKKFKHFIFSSSQTIHELCNTLSDLDNLYSVEISETMLENENIKKWVNHITSIEAGCFIEQNGIDKKIISYYPILSVQNGFDRIKWEHELNIGGKIINNLNELVFYVNGSIHGSDEIFRQKHYPIKLDKSLEINLIKSFVNQCKNEMLTQITFIGDMVNYKSFELLRDWCLSNNQNVEIIMLAEDIEKDISKFKGLNSDNFKISVIVNNYLAFSKHFELYQSIIENVSFAFYVKSINEFESVFSIVEELNIINYSIVPLFDGTNTDFFAENIYMAKDEFETIKLSKREVFANMTLNTNFFGKLTIMPDSKIYSNVNYDPLGTIGDPIYDMIYKEMTDGNAWFQIRDKEPCQNCIYQWLCPSPGCYEQAIGKLNLCHISE